MIIEISAEQLAKIQHLLNCQNVLNVQMTKKDSFSHYTDSILEIYGMEDWFILQQIGVTHEKIREMWYDDLFDYCRNGRDIVFVFEFKLYYSKPNPKQLVLFKARSKNRDYTYS